VDSVHDMGGMQGYGAAYWPGSEAPTHADWELRAFVLALVTGPGSAHAFRHTIERLDPVRYLSASYYERWLYEAEQALVESGAITHEEVAAWERRLDAGEEMPRTSDADGAAKLVQALRRRHPLEPATDARFSPGERVRVRRMRPAGHTRCPRYLRGARGTIARVQGTDGVPDVDNAETEAVYAVAFDSAELWGDDVGRHVVHADLWERYLEPDHV
jgi:nitrile hydratase beta subunit